MNCKPGDLAIVIGSSEYAGMLVEVLYVAPTYDFKLPDGSRHNACPPAHWVLCSLGSKMKAPLFVGRKKHGYTFTQYGCGSDAMLRPIRGDQLNEDRDELLEISNG